MLMPPTAARTRNWPDRALVTDSQRLAHPVKWRKSAVMTDRWRLVNGRELFDIESDPGQRHDLAAAHPGVVLALRGAYDEWWAEGLAPVRRRDSDRDRRAGCDDSSLEYTRLAQ